MRAHAPFDTVGADGASQRSTGLWSVSAVAGENASQPIRAESGNSVASPVSLAVVSSVSQSGIPLLLIGTVPLTDQSKRRSVYLFTRRVVDMVGAATLLLLFAPIMALIALAIGFSSSGPVLGSEERVGLGRRRFRLLKFRTTKIEARDHADPGSLGPRGEQFTPVGKFLRDYGLDGLPQFFNVLIGNMSFVGPRPHAPGMSVGNFPYENLVSYYHVRHEMRPGLIGWAQVNGYQAHAASTLNAAETVDHDVAYVRNASLALDIETVRRMFAREFSTKTDY